MAEPAIFFYEVESLRIDGDYSADPSDYADRPVDARLGSRLDAFLVAHLPSRLTPRGLRAPARRGPSGRYAPGRGLSWPVPHALPVSYNPTRRDLDFWKDVKWVRIGCGGLRVLTGIPPSRRQQRRPGIKISLEELFGE